jgi:hypothetical protein
LPPGVSTSQAISLSVWNASGVQKLFTCRLHRPAPRSSTGTSAAGWYRAGSRCRHIADGRATTAPSSDFSTADASRGRYAKSVTPENTSFRPSSSNVLPSTSTTTSPPDSGSTSISDTSVNTSYGASGDSATTRSPEYSQPADPGFTITRCRSSETEPAGR